MNKDFSFLYEPTLHTGVLVFADGRVFYGTGFGYQGSVVGEVCFNTALTGYQEVLTDPSYAGQIVTFTFPHIGNVGTNPEDYEADKIFASGFIVRSNITSPSSWRATNHLIRWAEENKLVGLCDIDTRALTSLIRDEGMPHAVMAYHPQGKFDIEALKKQAAEWKGLVGADLAKDVTCDKPSEWTQKQWDFEKSFKKSMENRHHVVALDFGAKKNILRCLADNGCHVTILPASASYDEIMSYNPDGIFLSNGPGDPAATGKYVVPVLQKLMKTGKPIFGICLGHQILALALGATTEKMKFGHHGANHPVKNLETGQVEITSMNHGFAVDRATLPSDIIETHQSLFDGTNCGLRVRGRPFFSVQYHPEASPGPQDSQYLFAHFVELMTQSKAKVG